MTRTQCVTRTLTVSLIGLRSSETSKSRPLVKSVVDEMSDRETDESIRREVRNVVELRFVFGFNSTAP